VEAPVTVPDQAGKTVVITGANSGIGLEAARALAAAKARVVLACRDPGRAQQAVERVSDVARGPAPEAVPLDLADLDSVRACAASLRERIAVVDVLMLNGGVMAMPRSRTEDGFEIHLGTNHLGHFALAGQMIDQLLVAEAPRVVVTSSLAHWVGRVRWSDPNWTARWYSASLAYGQSKLANLLFVDELCRRVRAAGHHLLAVAAHPGSARTNLATQNQNPLVRATYGLLRARTTQSAADGALPLLHAAVAPGLKPGSYWGPSGPLELHGPAGPAARSRFARDASAARRLWEMSERLTGVRWSDPLVVNTQISNP
jgi:NAD(P)-dependent dehydrogenase (short-subunit alcohol dehydrogenase family)